MANLCGHVCVCVCVCMRVYSVIVCLLFSTSTWPSTGSCLSSFLPSLHSSLLSAIYVISLSLGSSEMFLVQFGHVRMQCSWICTAVTDTGGYYCSLSAFKIFLFMHSEVLV